jgi:hypothetical protein
MAKQLNLEISGQKFIFIGKNLHLILIESNYRESRLIKTRSAQ